ncbi:MAG: universal stress protein [Candidatus Eisenbacteria bacterium]|uniref:Universal stress protein n=1 Tax=Eiseniibacteriota bacterium TaxID=2212470 RepID=A0A9D6QMP9_UNCEI|nr:universal stress protein [Candidatus Eisenbacteria bacterium]MBI3539993.1 universal stress protein [Candidatus Eisenbacteria bacterium]
MKILLGVDDSPHARAAVEYVRTMQWPKPTRVTVLSVVRPLVTAYVEAYAPLPHTIDEAEAEQMSWHQETASDAERVLRGAGFETEAKVLRGDPRDVLVEMAKAERADLVVVGSHGRTGMAKLLLGSVASHVVTHAPCNVMVVKLPDAPGRRH